MTPLELDQALEDHMGYHNAYLRHQMELLRLIGTITRNKGLRERDQLRDSRQFWNFPWDSRKDVQIPTKEDWAALDRKYNKKARP